jgi:hypothetical protein
MGFGCCFPYLSRLVVSRIFGLESEDSSLLAIFEGERKDLSLLPRTRVF